MVSGQDVGNLSANEHLGITRSLDFATGHSDRAGQIHLACAEKTADEDYFLSAESPDHLALVDRVNVVDLHAYVAGGGGTVEDGHLHVLGSGESLSLLLLAYAEMHLCNLGQQREALLEVSFLALQHILEILSQRHVAERTHEDSFGLVLGVRCDIVGPLTEESEQAGLAEQRDGALCILHTLGVECGGFVLTVGSNLNAQHLTAVAALYESHSTAYRRNELHFGMQFVNEQSIPGLDCVTFLDHNLGFHTCEAVREKCILLRGFHSYSFQACLALQVYVEAFA